MGGFAPVATALISIPLLTKSAAGRRTDRLHPYDFRGWVLAVKSIATCLGIAGLVIVGLHGGGGDAGLVLKAARVRAR
jgi:hypothetical protein